jgi:glycosyltransferase involved in cell wall biosynthesis
VDAPLIGPTRFRARHPAQSRWPRGPEKNLALLVQAFSGVAETVPNAHLLILGTGPALEEVQKLALGSTAAANIHFLGRVSYDQVPPYLAMCDAFVTPSVSEVHPLSVIESMAAGLPVRIHARRQ